MSLRTILHVDLDAFFASVEQRDHPELRGRPVIVGGPSKRSVVCAASYEARRYGVHSAMSLVEAMRRCPQAAVVSPQHGCYAQVSTEFFAILERFSPLVEGISVDEAFLDVTGEERLLGDGPTIGRSIKEKVRDELRLIVSVGVAPSKFVAKIASDVGKPDGLVVVGPDEVERFLASLPVGRLWGVGQATEQTLRALGLTTIGDVRRAPNRLLEARVGKATAAHLQALARGEDDREVTPGREALSVGQEDTFELDVRDREQLRLGLLEQADRACARLRRQGGRAHVVTVKVKYADHRLITRRRTLDRATADGRKVGRVAGDLLADIPDIERLGVRLTGVSLSGLEDKLGPRQLTFDHTVEEKDEQLGETLDEISQRFGREAVRRATSLERQGPPSLRRR